MILRALGLAAGVSLAALPAFAAGIMVLTKAEPGLSETGRPVWFCTYVVENREVNLVRETRCPPSLEVT